jgi:uncharacterized membrane protein YedE/YeeE
VPELEPATLLLLGGLLLGLLAGALLQASHFCVMGAVADRVLFGSTRRLKVWWLAIATAVLGTQGLAAAGLVPLEASGHLAGGIVWGPALLGGLLFGFGMVLTGGCASRTLVRAASGSLKALVVLLVMAVAAWTAQLGLLAPLHRALREAATLPVAGAGGAALWRPLADLAGLSAEAARLLLALAVGLALAVPALTDRRLRASPLELATGPALGLLVVGGWLLTGRLAADPFGPPAAASLSYVAPVGQSLLLLMTGGGPGGLGPGLVAGTALGALVVACATRGFRLEGFVSTEDLGRHLVGAVLMGTGGVLAMGCTIGQGVSGLSTLAATSVLAVAAIVAGAAWALAWLESGRLLPRWVRARGGPSRPGGGPAPLAGAAGRGYVRTGAEP